MLKHALEYHHDSALLFECIAHLEWVMFLDSGQLLNPATGKAGSQYGRYDVLVAEPFMTFVTRGNVTEISQNGRVEISEQDPFQLVNHALANYPVETSDLPDKSFPFSGGAMGYFAYDLARRIEKLSDHAQIDEALPQMMIGLYDWAVVVDHRLKTAHLVSYERLKSTRENFDALRALFSKASSGSQVKTCFEITSNVVSNMTKAQYANAFTQVQKYIYAGDCYQVNLAQRFSAQAQGDGWVAYQKLREISPAPFMAYMRLPNLEVLSASPERFLQVVGTHVETRPIKGTRPRAHDAEQDAKNAEELQHSLKDRAENLMIVDLLRNDIGKNCEIGSVKAEKLFQLQSFANVHHLVSIITGKLAQGCFGQRKTALDLLRGCFPGGSITGAPKLRAMQIIDELEPSKRGLYCGAIGYVGFDGNMDTNIAIRTVVYVHHADATGELNFYAGGGIVADSILEKEYAETLDKASSIMKMVQYFNRISIDS
ncbi:MAG: aminodeoxychorismate synthase component I [Methylotenera sp.]